MATKAQVQQSYKSNREATLSGQHHPDFCHDFFHVYWKGKCSDVNRSGHSTTSEFWKWFEMEVIQLFMYYCSNIKIALGIDSHILWTKVIVTAIMPENFLALPEELARVAEVWYSSLQSLFQIQHSNFQFLHSIFHSFF